MTIIKEPTVENMLFLESPRFPEPIAAYYSGGPCFYTEIVRLPNGFEQRNAPWSSPLRRYDITSSLKSTRECADILDFFNSVRGRWRAFRFRDRLDYTSATKGTAIQSTDQLVGMGDGQQACFQLVKTVVVGEMRCEQIIQKPVSTTVQVAVDGIIAENVHVDDSTGVIRFTDDAVPPPEAVITAGFEFDIPCRFDTDQLLIQYQQGDLGSFTVPLVEVRLPLAALNVEKVSESKRTEEAFA